MIAAPSPATAEPAAPAAASAVPGQPRAQVTVAYSSSSYDILPLWMAEEAGYLTRNGLDVSTTLLQGGQSAATLLAGAVQFAHVGGSEVISAIAEGADLVVVAILGGVVPFLFIVAPGITSFDELKGAKIATTTIGSSSYIAERLILEKEGLDPDTDVVFVPGMGATQTLSAILTGAVQAGVVDRAVAPTLTPDQGHVLFDPASGDNTIPIASSTVTVARSWLQSHRDLTQAYIDSLVQGLAREKQDRAFTLQVLTKYALGNDPAALEPLYDFASSTQQLFPYPLLEQFTGLDTELAKLNPKVANVDLASILDPSFVQSASDRHVDASA